jgi:hypothetical protein
MSSSFCRKPGCRNNLQTPRTVPRPGPEPPDSSPTGAPRLPRKLSCL